MPCRCLCRPTCLSGQPLTYLIQHLACPLGPQTPPTHVLCSMPLPLSRQAAGHHLHAGVQGGGATYVCAKQQATYETGSATHPFGQEVAWQLRAHLHEARAGDPAGLAVWQACVRMGTAYTRICATLAGLHVRLRTWMQAGGLRKFCLRPFGVSAFCIDGGGCALCCGQDCCSSVCWWDSKLGAHARHGQVGRCAHIFSKTARSHSRAWTYAARAFEDAPFRYPIRGKQ